MIYERAQRPDPEGMIYEYVNQQTGERRQIVRPMKQAPQVVFTDQDGTWMRVWSIAPAAITKTTKSEVNHRGQKLPVSRSLPPDMREGGTVARRGGHLVREFKDGTACTMDGKRIIDTPKARDRHAKMCGYESE